MCVCCGKYVGCCLVFIFSFLKIFNGGGKNRGHNCCQVADLGRKNPNKVSCSSPNAICTSRERWPCSFFLFLFWEAFLPRPPTPVPYSEALLPQLISLTYISAISSHKLYTLNSINNLNKIIEKNVLEESRGKEEKTHHTLPSIFYQALIEDIYINVTIIKNYFSNKSNNLQHSSFLVFYSNWFVSIF